jgi:hypothetical protein
VPAGKRAAAATALALIALRGEPARRSSTPAFQTSDRCIACHNGLTTSSGEDVSIGFAWRASMMANSARDPYWQAGVRREVTDHPAARAHIEDECAKCHMPMARHQAKAGDREGEVFVHLGFDPGAEGDRLAVDGVSCSLCHQIGKEKLGTRESFVGGFVIDPPDADGFRAEYGPYKVEAGLTRIMRSSSRGFRPVEAPHSRQSEVCATCHTLYTKALGPDGKVIGELPEQVPYQEWLHSEYRDTRSCQSCHMPEVREETRIASVLGAPREGLSRHTFVGGNFFMLRMLNRYRNELRVAALPSELDAAADRTVAFLQSETARLAIVGAELRHGRLEAEVSVENLSGHKLPTAYPSRRAWLRFAVRDRDDRVLFESGAFRSDGSIAGNNNDNDATRFEPHYAAVTAPDQVQIYESVMGDAASAPTTALLKAVRYLKDNRLLPRGFDKRSAHPDVAVIGEARDDADFLAGGDRVRYSVAVGDTPGPLRVDVELWFQPVAWRWADNLRRYDAAETRRFVAWYDAMSAASAVVLARASSRVPID